MAFPAAAEGVGGGKTIGIASAGVAHVHAGTLARLPNKPPAAGCSAEAPAHHEGGQVSASATRPRPSRYLPSQACGGSLQEYGGLVSRGVLLPRLDQPSREGFAGCGTPKVGLFGEDLDQAIPGLGLASVPWPRHWHVTCF